MEVLGFVILFAAIGFVGAVAYWVFQLALLGVFSFVVISVLFVCWNLLS